MDKKKEISLPYFVLGVSLLIILYLFLHFIFGIHTYTNLLIFTILTSIPSYLLILFIKNNPKKEKNFRIFLLIFLLILYLYLSFYNYINIEFVNLHLDKISVLLFATLAVLLTTAKESSTKRYSIKKWVTTFLLVVIILVGAGLRIKDTKNLSFRNDEYQVVAAAAGYRYTGTFMYWNFLTDTPDSIQSCPELDETCNYYTRAYPHSMLIALSFRLFGISELSARIPSLVFGILLIPLSFFFAKYITKRDDISLIYTFLIANYGLFIHLSKYTRMYALVIPITILSVYFLYRGLFEKPRKEISNKFLSSYFSYRYVELIVGSLLLYLAYLLHINVVAIVPVLFIFIIYKFLSTREKKYLPIILLGVLFIVISVLNFNTSLSIRIIYIIFKWMSPFGRFNSVYLSHLIGYPLNLLIAIPLILSSILFIKKLKLKEQRDHLVFLIICTITVIISFVFIADRYASSVYVSMFMPFSFLLVTWLFFLINEKIISNIKNRNLFVILLLIIIMGLPMLLRKVEDTDPSPPLDHKRAYSIINERFDPEKDIILGQYLRNYYLDPERIDPDRIYSLNIKERLTYEEFLELVRNAPSGYIVWADNKKWHIRPEIRQYCCDNFEQLSGESCSEPVNDYRIEIFYFSNE